MVLMNLLSFDPLKNKQTNKPQNKTKQKTNQPKRKERISLCLLKDEFDLWRRKMGRTEGSRDHLLVTSIK